MSRWALVKDKNVAKRMIKFIELNTIGVSKDSQLRASKILKAVSDGYELPVSQNNHRLFDFGRQLLSIRWQKLQEAVKASDIFSLPDFPLALCKFTGEKTGTYPGMLLMYQKMHIFLPKFESKDMFAITIKSI